MSNRLEGAGGLPAAFYQTLCETVSIGLVACDTSGRIRTVNNRFLEQTGFDREAIIGSERSMLFDPDTAARLDSLSATDESERRNVTVQTAADERVRGECRILPAVADDQFHGAVVLFDSPSTDETESPLANCHPLSDRELERRNRQQSTIATLGERALECSDLDQLMADVTEAVAETLETTYCKVLDLDTDDGELLLRQGVGWREGVVGTATVATDENSQAGYTLQSATPVVVTDLSRETRFSGPDLLTSHDVTSGISVIIGTVEEPWGILGVHDTGPQQFSDDDVAFVQSVANVLATAIDRRKREQLLEHQREQLATLDELNSVVRGIIDTIIEQSTREEIEGAVCTHLARANSYAFAWIGEVDADSQQVVPRAEANASAYLEAMTISADPDDEHGQGPTGRAIRTQEMEVTRDVRVDARHRPWRDAARECGYQSSAAIPIVHEETVYGVLNVYTERKQAFADQEQAVVGQLGEIVGHAIAALERKRALTSDEVVEIRLQVRDLFGQLAASGTDQRITFDQTIPIGDGQYVVYGTTTDEGLGALEEIVATEPTWESLTVISDAFGEVRFELRLTRSKLISTVTTHGGAVERAILEDGDFSVTVQLPQGADVRQVIDALQEINPRVEPLTRRQISRTPADGTQCIDAWTERLTNRQRQSLEAAYFAGFFEWPRDQTGEAVAESMGLSPATFHQHLRAGTRRLLETVLESERE